MGSQSDFANNNISRQFLSEAVGPDFDIQQYKVRSGTKPGDNFTSLIYSAEVEAKNKAGDDVTLDLLLKCYPSHPSRQEFGNNSNMFFKELEVYRLWLPELRRFQTELVGLEEHIELPYPKFFHGKCIDFESVDGSDYEGKEISPLENYIIMEDIRKTGGFRMTNRRDPMDIDHVRLVVKELAKVHSLSWAYKSHTKEAVTEKFPCLVNKYFSEDRTLMTAFFDSGVREAIKTLDDIMGPGNSLSQAVLKFKDGVDTVYNVFVGNQPDEALDGIHRLPNNNRFGKDAKDPVPWRIICHGDCWSNNMLFRYDEKSGKPLEVILVDLQMVRETCVMPDLVYSIYACTDAALRKAHLNELMELYVDTFNEFCQILKVETLPGFTLESFKFRFHRFKVLGLLMAIALFPIMLKEEQEALAMDMENMDKDKSLVDMFSDVCQTSGVNPVYKDRLVGMLNELIDEGAI